MLLSELAPLLVGSGAKGYLNGHDHDMQHIIVDGVSCVRAIRVCVSRVGAPFDMSKPLRVT